MADSSLDHRSSSGQSSALGLNSKRPSIANPSPMLGSEAGRSESRAGSISTLWSSADCPFFLDTIATSQADVLRRSSGAASCAADSAPRIMLRNASSSSASSLQSLAQNPRFEILEHLEENSLTVPDAQSLRVEPTSTRALPASEVRGASAATPTSTTFSQLKGTPTRLQKRRPSALQLDHLRHSPRRDINAASMPISVSYDSQLYTARSFSPGRSTLSQNTPSSSAFRTPTNASHQSHGTRCAQDVLRANEEPHKVTEGRSSGSILASADPALYGKAQRYFSPSYSMDSPTHGQHTPGAFRQASIACSPSQRRTNLRHSASTYGTEESIEVFTPRDDSASSRSGSSMESTHEQLLETKQEFQTLSLALGTQSRPATAPAEDSILWTSHHQPLREASKPVARSPTSPLQTIASRSSAVRHHRGDVDRPRTSENVTPPHSASSGRSDFSAEMEFTLSTDTAITVKKRGLSARLRAVSTPKLRAAAAWRFNSTDTSANPLPTIAHPTSPLSSAVPLKNQTAATKADATRPIRPVSGGRFRSRTLGEADRRHTSSNSDELRRCILERPETSRSNVTGLSSTDLKKSRRPSRTDTIESSPSSCSHSILQTPQSSTTHLAGSVQISSPKLGKHGTVKAPVRPTSARPKSKGGWASHLAEGLTLHLEHEGKREIVRMTYLYYDPFGAPESLCNNDSLITANGRPATPKRPKSKGGVQVSADEQLGILEFGPAVDPSSPSTPTAISFRAKNEGSSPSMALLRHLTVGDDMKGDLLARQANLSLAQVGTNEVSGIERKGSLAWRFTYNVDVDAGSRTKILRPVGFSCSATLLDPVKARKGRLLNMMRKQMIASNIDSVPVIGSPASAPAHLAGETMPRTPSDDGTSCSMRPLASSPVTLTHPDSGALSRPIRQSLAPSDTSSARSLHGNPPTGQQFAPGVSSNAPNHNLVPFKMNRAALAKRSFASLSSKHGPSAQSTDLPASPPRDATFVTHQHQPKSAGLLTSTALSSESATLPPGSSYGIQLRVHGSPTSRRRGASVGQEDANSQSRSRYQPQTSQLAGVHTSFGGVEHMPTHHDSNADRSLSPRRSSQRARAKTSEHSATRRPPTASEEVKAAYLALQARPATGHYVQPFVGSAATQAGWFRRPSTAQDAHLPSPSATHTPHAGPQQPSPPGGDEGRNMKQLPRLPAHGAPEISKRTSSSRLKAFAQSSKWTQHRQMSDDQSAQFLDSLHDQGFL
ncbi:hypothetical protein IE81DRAFT_30434 [Ceraceosorus guamensis]|uniref:Uncharacterized protein n=1 Tax=Ceraceosorus guamensis TaxID=1522189 RepID=A0A316W8G7_9BASI|nr:hypothetical protein IE81DRAFT_30434 [Ceraceosorus guamensis]PWN44333.1 hypothetical protein IE81DRAFT_30434 [Ceraceosorus guamensis]